MGPLRKVTTVPTGQVQQLHTISNSVNGSASSPQIQAGFRLLRIIRGPAGGNLHEIIQTKSPNPIMLRTMVPCGQDVFRSMQVQNSSKTPYSDATQVSQNIFIFLIEKYSNIQIFFEVSKYFLSGFKYKLGLVILYLNRYRFVLFYQKLCDQVPCKRYLS